MTLRNLRELRCEKSITEHFVVLITTYLSNSPNQEEEINDELLFLIELCNHHRETLWSIHSCETSAHPHFLKTWLAEIASPPSGEWAKLRLLLTPFIRTFGRLPRPRGSQLFSPLDEALAETGRRIKESGAIDGREVTTVREGDCLEATAPQPKASGPSM